MKRKGKKRQTSNLSEIERKKGDGREEGGGKRSPSPIPEELGWMATELGLSGGGKAVPDQSNMILQEIFTWKGKQVG